MHPRVSVNSLCFPGADLAAMAGHWRAVGAGRVSFVSNLLGDDVDVGSRILGHGGHQLEAITHLFFDVQNLSWDTARWAAERDRLDRTIDAAAKLGGRSVYLMTGGHAAMTWEEAADCFSQAVAPCVARADDAGVRLMIETTSPFYADGHLAHTLRDTVTLAELAGVGVCVDVWACWTEAGLAETIARAVPRCSLVQVSDYVYGAHGMTSIFIDQGTDPEANEVVAEFVREHVATTVTDPDVAERLMPRDYPIGTRRLAVDVGSYYATYNRDNVTLVDLKQTPIERITAHGVRTSAEDIQLDTLILATGFDAMTGALYRANLTGIGGQTLRQAWRRGPTTLAGLMTRGFPNLLMMVGPGSPSVLANLFAGNEHHAQWITRLLCHARERGLRRVEPRLAAQQAWDAELDQVASRMLRYRVKNYMVHVNPDGSRVFQPYPGGFHKYVEYCAAVEEGAYRELELA